jgi:hypothetical protein
LWNHFDSLKADVAHEEELEDELEEWAQFSDGELANAMVNMFEADDASELDWLPERLKNKKIRERKRRKASMHHPSHSHILSLMRETQDVQKRSGSHVQIRAHTGGTHKLCKVNAG